MNMKRAVVFLLALAGSVSVILVTRSSTHFSAPPREPAVIAPQRPARNSHARSVPARQVTSSSHSHNPVRGRPNNGKSLPPGLAHVSIPITFEPNVGQTDSRIKFLGRGKGLTIFLTQDEIALRVGQSKSSEAYPLNSRAPARSRAQTELLRCASPEIRGSSGKVKTSSVRRPITLSETIRRSGTRGCRISRARKHRACLLESA